MLWSVVVNDLNLLCTCVTPLETNPPLVVDADAVLTGARAFEPLQSVAGHRSQIFYGLGGTKLPKLPQSSSLNAWVHRRHTLAAPEALSVAVAEGSNHPTSL
jgi:hypothetical protein